MLFDVRSQLVAVLVSQVLPTPFHETSRGKPVDVTTKAQVCVKVCAALSVTVKSNRALPVRLSVGVKVTFRLPTPLCMMVPPMMFETVKTGASLKPAVNLDRSICTLVGEPAMLRGTVP